MKEIATGFRHILGTVKPLDGEIVEARYFYNFGIGTHTICGLAVTDVYIGGRDGKDYYYDENNGWSHIVKVPAGKNFIAKVIKKGDVYNFSRIEVEIF